MFEQFALPVFTGLLAALGSYIALFDLSSLNKRVKPDKKVYSQQHFLFLLTEGEISKGRESKKLPGRRRLTL